MRYLPRSLFGRLVVLMTAGLVVAQLAGGIIHFAERQRSLGQTVGQELAHKIAAFHRAVSGQDAQGRGRLAEQLSTPRLRLTVEAQAPSTTAAATMLETFPGELRKQLDAGVEVRAIELPRFGNFAFDLYLRLGPGEWLRVRGNAPDELFARPWHLLINLGTMLLAIGVLVIFVARGTVRPLTELARAARGLTADLKQAPLPEDGPSEVMEAARAFNAMQARLREGIEEREQFLAAVSHDLKTPITRLRLRAEMLDDPALRERFRRDAEEMQQLLDSALDFLRGNSVDEPLQPLDLADLLESLVDDYTSVGEVTLDAPASLRIQARPRALKRALSNLIDNALKYGGRADVAMPVSSGQVRVVVEDAGPGLPTAELERVFAPFYRVEGSRNRETGGTGLGLAIARKAAREHGGEVVLENRVEGGLRAVLTLPLIA